MPEVKDLWTNFSSLALDLVYPPKCSLCGLFSKENPCVQCIGEMVPNHPVFTYHDDRELAYEGIPYRYSGRPGQAVRQLKYRRSTGLAKFMADSLHEAATKEGLDFDIAVPVPIHWFRLAWRGFNQAELLAGSLPRNAFALRRIRATRPQAGLSTTQRLTNLDGAFETCMDVKGKRILLIDDVVTSGRTARECAKVLRLAGALEVGILAFCGDVPSEVAGIDDYGGDHTENEYDRGDG